ncbi:hypothetical protein F2Q68_00031602 [Brassica cretica]|uniref:Uncharacterized protein n=1 Tax=Brassica cretica TaxID=69181 RepID=A0A8S9GDT1_BRACR|nr:hypothetical protein F2Q68_00031602 [Brassica cretica]
MVQEDATFDALGGEPTPTPEAAPPIAADFMSSIMARLARQDEVQKTTNDQLAALVAAPVIRINLTHKFTETAMPLTSELGGGGLIVGDGLHPSTRPIE